MSDFKETCVNHVAPDNFISFCSSEKKWINKVMRLHEKHPDKVKIIHAAEDNYGVLCADLPSNWLKISPPRNYTDEQRAEMAERLAAAREKRG